MSSNMEIKKRCIYCHNEFIAKTTFTKYCSHRCNQKHYKLRKKEAQLQNEIETKPKEFANEEIRKAQMTSGVIKEEFMNVKEACRFLRISKGTLYNLIKKGIVKKHKLNARSIFKRSELEAIFND
ncbi:helix-turn-helix domain-containing protein [Sediminitomix flava]|nr:helix-turn-helix domain-containing protein [Sediminitomix flava]